jgi:signal peptidase II
LRKRIIDYLFLFSLAGSIIVLDQWTKMMVRTQIPLGEKWAPWAAFLPFIQVVHWSNTGAAFGLFQGFGEFFTILAIVVITLIVFYYPKVPRGDWPLRVALGMQFGGATGNLIDRLTIGHVTDFIAVGSFPVFNVADASISVGVAVLLLGTWITNRGEKPAQISPEVNQPPEQPSNGDGEQVQSE